ncbi:MAG: hypothetical protein WCP03_04150 [Candidatus Saccharibacteria bacterium]
MPSTRNKSSNSKDVELEKRLSLLESEVNEMKKTIKATNNKFHSKLKFWSSTLLIVIASIFFVFSLAGFWLKQNIVNTNVWVNKTSAVIQDPNVRNDISVALTDTIFTKFDAKQYITELLPEKAQPLAGPLSSNLKSFTQKEIDKALQSQQFITFWENLNQKAHSSLIKSLEKADTNSKDKNDLLYFDDDKLMLNIQPIYANIRDKMAAKGLNFVDRITPNQVDKQVQIAKVKNMPEILLGFNLINKAGLLMLIPMLLFGIAGLLIAVDRRKALMIFGISSVVLLITNVQALYLSKYPFMDNFKSALQSSDSASAQAIFNIYTKDLIYLDRLAIVLMVILVLFAFLSGPAKISVWLRLQVSKLFTAKSNSPIVIWLSKNANYLITGILIFAFIFTIFPIIHSVWYLVTLYILVGLICVLLLSIKSTSLLQTKKNKKK